MIEPKEKESKSPRKVPIPNQCGAQLTVQGRVRQPVPRPDDDKVKRDSSGSVTSPLQSQADVNNFRYLATTTDWWKGAQFAGGAFWIHA